MLLLYTINQLGILVQPETIYTFTPTQPIQLTSVTLDTQLKTRVSDVQLWFKNSTMENLIAMMTKQLPHVSLNLIINAGETVTFFIRGGHPVYVNGNVYEQQFPQDITDYQQEMTLGSNSEELEEYGPMSGGKKDELGQNPNTIEPNGANTRPVTNDQHELKVKKNGDQHEEDEHVQNSNTVGPNGANTLPVTNIKHEMKVKENADEHEGYEHVKKSNKVKH